MTECKKFCFTSMSYGVLTKTDSVITRWATKNGHARVDTYEEANFIFNDDKMGGYPSSDIKTSLLHKVKKAKDAWIYLHNEEEVTHDGLIDLFKQACSDNTETSRLGLELIYRLRGDKYIDVQNIIELCKFQQLAYVARYGIFKSIVGNHPIQENNLPLSVLKYIESKNIYCKEVAVPLFNWIFNEYPITRGSTKVEIKLS